MSASLVSSGVRFRIVSMTSANFPVGLRRRVSAVPTVSSDVPDGEDAFRVADADLDVGFFTDPAPRVDSFCTRSRHINGAGGVELDCRQTIFQVRRVLQIEG